MGSRGQWDWFLGKRQGRTNLLYTIMALNALQAVSRPCVEKIMGSGVHKGLWLCTSHSGLLLAAFCC